MYKVNSLKTTVGEGLPSSRYLIACPQSMIVNLTKSRGAELEAFM